MLTHAFQLETAEDMIGALVALQKQTIACSDVTSATTIGRLAMALKAVTNGATQVEFVRKVEASSVPATPEEVRPPHSALLSLLARRPDPCVGVIRLLLPISVDISLWAHLLGVGSPAASLQMATISNLRGVAEVVLDDTRAWVQAQKKALHVAEDLPTAVRIGKGVNLLRKLLEAYLRG